MRTAEGRLASHPPPSPSQKCPSGHRCGPDPHDGPRGPLPASCLPDLRTGAPAGQARAPRRSFVGPGRGRVLPQVSRRPPRVALSLRGSRLTPVPLTVPQILATRKCLYFPSHSLEIINILFLILAVSMSFKRSTCPLPPFLLLLSPFLSLPHLDGLVVSTLCWPQAVPQQTIRSRLPGLQTLQSGSSRGTFSP